MSTRIRISAFLLIVALGGACSSKREPEPSPQAYREAVTAFYVGVSAMQTTQEVLARQKFDRVVALVPQEPAGWANLGLLLLRQQELEQGAQQLARAADAGARQRGDPAAAGARRRAGAETSPKRSRHWRRALELDPDDLEAAYALALETERQGGPENDAEAQRMLEQLRRTAATTWRRASSTCAIAAKRGDQAALNAAIAPLADVVAGVVAGSAGPADRPCRRRRPPTRGRPRRACVPEERPAARAGVSRGPRRGQHAARGGRPAR